ncbi:hypothetical protein AH06_135 [Erwinia phage AH06]|nr:hypothetical protein AH06_135 [Erwinia phage AH06]
MLELLLNSSYRPGSGGGSLPDSDTTVVGQKLFATTGSTSGSAGAFAQFGKGGSGGKTASGGTGGNYGGGGGMGSAYSPGTGGIRLIWGKDRSFPSTLTADQPTSS